MDERLTRPWRAVEAVPVVLIAAVMTVIGGTVAGAFLPEGTALVVFGLVFEAALAGATLLWVLVVRRGALGDLGLSRSRAGAHALVGAAAGVAIFIGAALILAPVLVRLVSLFTSSDVSIPRQEVIPTAPSAVQVTLGALAVVAAAPFGEELFFRGFLFGGLRRRYGFHVSAGISAVVFGVFHVVPLLIPLMVAVGYGLAYVYERRGSLVAPIAAHAAFNIIGYSFIVRSLT